MTKNKNFIYADEAAEILSVSRTTAYKIIHKLNEELESSGYMTITGRTSRKYFNEKFYYMEEAN
jgi:transposase